MAENNSVSESAADGDSLEKKRARRRLVGATALAFLAAIVLPMVMDHEPAPAIQDIQVRIPSQDAPATPVRPLSSKLPPAVVAPKAEIESKSAPVEVAKLENSPVEPQIESKQAEKPAPVIKPEPVSAKAEPAHAEAAHVEAAKPEVTKATAAKPEKADAKSEAARAEKVLSGAATASNGQWILQLGAYQESGNVKLLQAKVKELGYASYTEKVETPQGTRIRVRGGPFASRDAAEKAQARLKKIGAGGPPGGVVAQK